MVVVPVASPVVVVHVVAVPVAVLVVVPAVPPAVVHVCVCVPVAVLVVCGLCGLNGFHRFWVAAPLRFCAWGLLRLCAPALLRFHRFCAFAVLCFYRSCGCLCGRPCGLCSCGGSSCGC